MAGRQPGASDSVLAEPVDYLFKILARTREHGVGSVIGGDRHAREVAGNLLDLLGVSEHRNHPPAFGQTAEHPAALGDQLCAVLQAEHSGYTCRRVLAHAVPQHHVGLDAPRLPQSGQAHLNREQSRLRKRGVPQRFSGPAVGLPASGEQHL